MKQKKGFKGFLHIILVTVVSAIFFVVSYNVKAEESNEMFKLFPKLENSIKTKTTGEKVQESVKYYKISLKKGAKDTKDPKNYDIKVVSKKDYEEAKKNIKNNRKKNLDTARTTQKNNSEVNLNVNGLVAAQSGSIQTLTTQDNIYSDQATETVLFGEDSIATENWIRLNLAVYKTNDCYTFRPYLYFEWLREPNILMTDLLAITTTDNMTYSEASVKEGEYGYDLYDFFTHDYYDTRFIDLNVKNFEHGVTAEIDLQEDMAQWDTFDHKGWMAANVEFMNKENHLSGRIFGKYAHKQFGGSIGIDGKGMFSFSLYTSVDEADYASVYVSFDRGWTDKNGVWYYYTYDGVKMYGWQNIGGVWYYLGTSGAMVTGWQSIGGVWYYFKTSGAMVTGWQSLGGVWYYFDSSGHMVTGWKSLGGVWYYFDSSGHMLTGWQSIGGVRYYFDSSGHMLTGSQYIGGTWYTFSSSGALIS